MIRWERLASESILRVSIVIVRQSSEQQPLRRNACLIWLTKPAFSRSKADRSQGAWATRRLSTAKLLGQFDHLTSVVSLIDFAKALAPFDLRAGGALAVTGSFQLDEGLPALTTVNATSAMAG